MMYKYIVTWCLNTLIIDSCPDKPKKDEFGRSLNSGYSCAAMHCHWEADCKNKKETTSRKEAFDFYNNGVKESKSINSFSMQTRVDNVKIDSIEIKH